MFYQLPFQTPMSFSGGQLFTLFLLCGHLAAFSRNLKKWKIVWWSWNKQSVRETRHLRNIHGSDEDVVFYAFYSPCFLRNYDYTHKCTKLNKHQTSDPFQTPSVCPKTPRERIVHIACFPHKNHRPPSPTSQLREFAANAAIMRMSISEIERWEVHNFIPQFLFRIPIPEPRCKVMRPMNMR